MATVIKLLESDEESIRDEKMKAAALEISAFIKEVISVEHGDKWGEMVMSKSCQNYIKSKIKDYLKDFRIGTFTIMPLEEDIEDVYDFLVKIKRNRNKEPKLEK